MLDIIDVFFAISKHIHVILFAFHRKENKHFRQFIWLHCYIQTHEFRFSYNGHRTATFIKSIYNIVLV